MLHIGYSSPSVIALVYEFTLLYKKIWFHPVTYGGRHDCFRFWKHPSSFTLNYIRKTANDFFSWTAYGNLTKLNRNGPWVVQMVLIGCISRSRGQKIGFQNAIFKNLFDLNYKAQGFHIWYIASSEGPLPKLFKLCPWSQNWPCPGGHNFTLNYIRKTANDFFSWTANGNFTKLNRNGPWVVPYQNYSNGSDWLQK